MSTSLEEEEISLEEEEDSKATTCRSNQTSLEETDIHNTNREAELNPINSKGRINIWVIRDSKDRLAKAGECLQPLRCPVTTYKCSNLCLPAKILHSLCQFQMKPQLRKEEVPYWEEQLS
jgi:hypothetical protein